MNEALKRIHDIASYMTGEVVYDDDAVIYEKFSEIKTLSEQPPATQLYPSIYVKDNDQCVMIIWFYPTKSMSLDATPELHYVIGGKDPEDCKKNFEFYSGKKLTETLEFRCSATFSYA